MNTDPYLATKDIEVRKRLCAEHMRAHLTPDNMSAQWYNKNYPSWYSRLMRLYNGSWNKPLQYAFSDKELAIWEQSKNNHNKIKNLKYTQNNIIEAFVKEYLRLKSFSWFGVFDFKKYKKYKSKEAPSINTIRRHFNTTIKNFYMQITRMYSEIYFDRIRPYVEEDYKSALEEAYEDNGLISQQVLDCSQGIYIHSTSYMREYGSLENACNKFHIPYKNPKRSKLFLYTKKEIEKLLPLEMIEEKEWPEWLFYKKPLSVDIFFPFFNLAIEVDGKQHYEEQSIFHIGKHDNFKTQQIRDKIKNIKLPKHNITLIRIRYDEVKRIPEILKYYVELLKTIQEYCAY